MEEDSQIGPVVGTDKSETMRERALRVLAEVVAVEKLSLGSEFSGFPDAVLTLQAAFADNPQYGGGHFTLDLFVEEVAVNILASCEQIFDSSEFAPVGPKGLLSPDEVSPEESAELREIYTDLMLRLALQRYIRGSRELVVDALLDAYRDALSSADYGLAAVVAAGSTQIGHPILLGDVRPVIDEAAKRVADRARRRYESMLAEIPLELIDTPRVGRPKVDFMRWAKSDVEMGIRAALLLLPLSYASIKTKIVEKLNEINPDTTISRRSFDRKVTREGIDLAALVEWRRRRQPPLNGGASQNGQNRAD